MTHVTRYLPEALGVEGLSSGSSLDKTLYGRRIALLGISIEGLIVAHQLADVAVRALPPAPLALPLKNYIEGHPYASPFAPQLSLGEANLAFDWRGTVELLGGEEQTVTQWALVGLDPDDPEETGAMPSSGAAIDRFGLGTSVTGAEALALAEGRLWLKWEGMSSAKVGEDAQLLTVFAVGHSGALSRAVILEGEVVADPVNYGTSHSEGQLTTSVALALGGFWPQTGDSLSRRVLASQALVEQASQLAETLIEAQFGEAPTAKGVTVVRCPPTDSVLLLHDPKEGQDLLTDAVIAYTGEAAFQFVTPDTAIADDTGNRVEVLLAKGFRTPPADHGLKITLQARIAESSDSLARGYVGLVSSEGKGTLLDFFHRPAEEGGSFVVGDAQWKSSVRNEASNSVPTEAGGVVSMGFQGQRYEVYLYPDRRAEFYVNGEFVRVVTLPEGVYQPEADFTIRLDVFRAKLQLLHLAVESFSPPDDYVPKVSLPRIEMLEVPDLRPLTPEQFQDTTSSSTVIELTHAFRTLDFTLTERGLLELDATLLQQSTFTSNGVLWTKSDNYIEFLRIRRIDGRGTFSLDLESFSGRAVIPHEFEAGRYRIELILRKMWRINRYIVIAQHLMIRGLRAFPLSGSGAKIADVAGPQELKRGDGSFGFYGEVSPTAFISSSQLGRDAGLLWTAYLSDVTWLKIAHRGKTLFVAKRAAAYNVNVEWLNDTGLRYGDRASTRLQIQGRWYLVRLLRETGTGSYSDEYRIFMKALTDGTWARYSSTQLGISSNVQGSHTVTASNYSRRRGSRYVIQPRFAYGLTGLYSKDLDQRDTDYGWRPVVELIA